MTTAGLQRTQARQEHPAYSSTPLRRITGWLRSPEARALDDPALLSSLGGRLHEAGLGFDRLLFHVGTLHPETFARILAWAPGEPVEIYERDHPATVAAGFLESPLHLAAVSQNKLVAQGVDRQFLGRAGGQLLQSRGIGEIVSAPVGRGGRLIIASFCAARPHIFRATDHLMIDAVIASLQQRG